VGIFPTADRHCVVLADGTMGKPWYSYRCRNQVGEPLSTGTCVYWAAMPPTCGFMVRASGVWSGTTNKYCGVGVPTKKPYQNRTWSWVEGWINVAIGMYSSEVNVYGTVAKDDWLVFSDTFFGTLRAATPGEMKANRCFVIALEAHTGDSSPIKTVVLPFRY